MLLTKLAAPVRMVLPSILIWPCVLLIRSIYAQQVALVVQTVLLVLYVHLNMFWTMDLVFHVQVDVKHVPYCSKILLQHHNQAVKDVLIPLLSLKVQIKHNLIHAIFVQHKEALIQDGIDVVANLIKVQRIPFNPPNVKKNTFCMRMVQMFHV